MRTNFELGLLHWVVRNRASAYSSEIIAINPTKDPPSTIRTLLQTQSVSREQIEVQGELLQRQSVAEYWAEHPIEYSPNKKLVILYNKPQKDAFYRDAVFPIEDPDTRTTRYGTFAIWQSTTCAVDTIMAIASLVDAGRIQADQIPHAHFLDRNLAAQMILQYVSYNPLSMTAEQHHDARGIILTALSIQSPSKYPSSSLYGFQPVQSMFEDCFHRLPQFSWTVTTTTTLCQEKRVKYGRYFNCNSLTVQLDEANEGCTLQDRINQVLHFIETLPTTRECSQGIQCSGHQEHRERNTVVDRTPPRLCIHLDGYIHYSLVRRHRCLDPVQLEFKTSSGEKKRQFNINGIIIRTNDNHYFLRWKIQPWSDSNTEILNINLGQVNKVESWWQDLDTSSTERTAPTISSIIYLDDRWRPQL